MKKAVLGLSLLFLVSMLLAADAPRSQAASLLATISVGTTPQQLQLTPDDSKLFVSNEGSNTVSVISTASDTVLATIPVGTNPGPIRFTPDGSKAYLVNEDSNTVSVISVATHVVTATIPVGNRPVTLSRTDDGTKVYVANELSNNVSVISTATDTVIGAPIPVGTAPHVMAKTPDGTKLYVANEGATANSVSVISTASDSVVATIPLSPSRDPGSIHFLPNGTKAYVANRGCAGITCVPAEVFPTVSVIDVASSSVTQTITGPGFGAGDAPHSMRITPDGSKLYLVNKHGDEVLVIDTATNMIVKNIQLQQGSCFNITLGVGSCPVRIELTPDGSYAYVVEQRPLAPEGTLTAICTGIVPAVCGGSRTDTVVWRSAVGNSPVDLEITSGGKAYVSNSGSNTVSVWVDSDGDGCPDANEQQTAVGSQASGGRRDANNPWDYFNPTKDHLNRVDDILAVVNQYFKDDADANPGLPPYAAGYNPGTDRTPLGPNAWNLGPPNGQQRVGDILAAVNQYFHDCS